MTPVSFRAHPRCAAAALAPFVLASLFVLALRSPAIGAQGFPNRPIKIIVPLAAAGTGDTLARAVGEEMAKELGQSVVVENRPGAGGLLGAESVATAPPDGYTLLATSPAHVINPALYSKRKTYDAIKDFEPITVMAYTHQMIAAHPSVPVKDLKELIAYAKQHPGRLNYGSAGTGSATHLNMEHFKYLAGVDIVHVPYKGSTPARNDVLSGQVQLVMDGLLPLQQFIENGRLRAIGITSSKRARSNPEIPAIGEVVPGYASDTWYGMLAPATTPKDIIARLNAAAGVFGPQYFRLSPPARRSPSPLWPRASVRVRAGGEIRLACCQPYRPPAWSSARARPAS